MNPGAKADVSSTDAIQEFRAALIVYLGKVRPVLDESIDECGRVRDWLRTERRLHWQNKVRQNTRALAEAQQALFSAELARLRPPSSAEVAAVNTCKRALAHAEEKLREVEKLGILFEKESGPRVKQIETLRGVIATGVPDGVAFLDRILAQLEAYAAVPPAGPAPSTSSEPGVEE